MTRTLLLSSFLALAVMASRPAEAQMRRVLDLNRRAMDAYTNLEVEESMDLLQQALQNAESNNVSGTPLANTHANLGIVAVGGFGDNAAGLQHFMNAIRAERDVALDPLNSTPDIQSVFLLARNRVGNNGGGNDGNGNGGGGIVRTPAEPGQIPHQPVPEQLANTAVPIFVEVPEGAPVNGITVHYQAPGMRVFRAVEMRRMEGGFGLELPCAEAMAPRVSYYIEAFDEGGERMGTAGTSESPFAVEIVSFRTMPAPALPGQPAPEQCTDTECPPGMECNQSGNAGLGATCVDTSECRAGLTCSDNFCIASEHEVDGDEPADNGDMPRFFADIGFTLGIGFASSGTRADAQGTDDSYVESGAGDCPDEGFQCVRLEQSGTLPTYAARLTLGYWIIPRFALAATIRFQFDSGEGSLSSLLIGLRAMYQLTAPTGVGFHADVFVGTSVGQIQLRPGQNGTEDNPIEEPYMVSGLNGVQVGTNVGYRFTRNVGITLTPELHVLFPQFLLNIDITASVAVAF
jgi:hypothetical protein